MGRWRMYLDDSATHGALMDKDLKPLKVDHLNGGVPITTAGGVLVAESAEREIVAEVRALRRRIRNELQVRDLPQLHMRLMWGANLPRKYNPYLLATPEQRFRWVKQGYDIVFKYGKLNKLKVAGMSLELPQVQEVLSLYANDEKTRLEHSFLKTHFPKAVGDFYGVIFNPLVRMIMNLIVAGDWFCREHFHRLTVFYDTSHASKGFSASDGMKILTSSRRFRSLDGIHESSPHESDLMQLADLVAYRIFRQVLTRYRRTHGKEPSTDNGMEMALRNRDMSNLGLSWPGGLKLETFHESLFAMLQTAYAAQPLRALYPEKAQEMLIPIDKYNVDVDEHGSLTGFFPVVYPGVLESWANGKRPPL